METGAVSGGDLGGIRKQMGDDARCRQVRNQAETGENQVETREVLGGDLGGIR